VAAAADALPASVAVVSTGQLFEGIDYQPVNPGTSMGRLRFVRDHELVTGYIDFREVVVLESLPGDLPVVAGIVTTTFQTPLSHVNVLAQNRGTPNMALRGAWDDPGLRALEGRWVRLDVGTFDHEVEEVTAEEADAWWEANRPEPLSIQPPDLTATELRDAEDVLEPGADLATAIAAAVRAFGGKASQFAALTRMDDLEVPRAFVIPMYHHDRFMRDNGFDVQVSEMLADETFRQDPVARRSRLAELRSAMREAPVDAALEESLTAKIRAGYPDTRMRFRSSTNAEDLQGFTGAGLYSSASGEIGDPEAPLLDALRAVWASVWNFRAFEERSHRGIDHRKVGMAVLVHRAFTDEEANGVGVTANPFDTTGLEPGFYVNVQLGESSVVDPDPGTVSDQLIYHYHMPGRPVVYLSHSNLASAGMNVLTQEELLELGRALSAIHATFRPVWGAAEDSWYAMEVEFKLDGHGAERPRLYVKQARPHPGWGTP
jgi:hypothetical protein